jgi:site-specific recombinase XerD
LIRIGKLAGIQKHFSFHSARHTNATLLIYKGVNITTVQKLLGHRNVSTTQIYSEVMGSTIVNDLKKCSKREKRGLNRERH